MFYYLSLYYSRSFHVENLFLCTYFTFVLLSRLTMAIRICNAKACSSALFIEGKSKDKTLGICIY